MTLTLSRRLVLILWMSCTAMALLQAQLSEKKEDPFSQKDQVQSQTQYQQGTQALKMAVMDGPVDPKEYIVGPGDIYSVNVWISPPLSLQLPVTPEGSIIIPTVGEVSVQVYVSRRRQKESDGGGTEEIYQRECLLYFVDAKNF